MFLPIALSASSTVRNTVVRLWNRQDRRCLLIQFVALQLQAARKFPICPVSASSSFGLLIHAHTSAGPAFRSM